MSSLPLVSLVALVALLCCPSVARAGGGWVAPLAGPIDVRRFFDPPDTAWGAGHRGVDVAAFPGAAVRAAGAGVVTFAGRLAGRGVVVVRHGALRTTYEPVSPLVGVGRLVAAGDPVATLDPGHPGPAGSGEALLHWGLLRGGTYLDPLRLLPRGPSRLLPLPPGAPAVPPAVGTGPAGPRGDGPPPVPAARPPRRGPPATAGLLAVAAAAVAAGVPLGGGRGRRPRHSRDRR